MVRWLGRKLLNLLNGVATLFALMAGLSLSVAVQGVWVVIHLAMGFY